MCRTRRILVFDSGLGGLTVARQLLGMAPAGVVVDYAADLAGFPYGDWAEDALRAHLVALVGRLREATAADVVVIACNTASTLALQALREAWPDVAFVGTVPAIKPAAALSSSGIVGVLATPGTVRRDYTGWLIDTFARHCRVVLHGARQLAALAEGRLRGEEVPAAALREQISPVFVQEEDGRRTDVVVLGCTHYPLLLRELREVAPWPVHFVDPSAAIARQALRMAGVGQGGAAPRGRGCARRAVVSGLAAGWSAQGLRRVLAREGFGECVMLDGSGRVA